MSEAFSPVTAHNACDVSELLQCGSTSRAVRSPVTAHNARDVSELLKRGARRLLCAGWIKECCMQNHGWREPKEQLDAIALKGLFPRV